MAVGYRLYKGLAPGHWFNSVGIDEYYYRYRTEIFAPLDPRKVRDDLERLAAGRVPVLLCYERPVGADWCHRAIAAEWLAEALGVAVPEFGYETRPQGEHPLMPPQLRREIVLSGAPDVTPYVRRTAIIDGELHTVASADPQRPGMAIVTTGGRSFPATIDTIRRHFNQA